MKRKRQRPSGPQEFFGNDGFLYTYGPSTAPRVRRAPKFDLSDNEKREWIDRAAKGQLTKLEQRELGKILIGEWFPARGGTRVSRQGRGEHNFNAWRLQKAFEQKKAELRASGESAIYEKALEALAADEGLEVDALRKRMNGK